MRIFRLLIGLSLVLTATLAFGIDVKTDYDRDFDLGSLKSFAFKEQRRGNNDPLRTNTLISDRIKTALESKLTANGFREDNGENADFLVAFYASSREKVDVESFGYGYPRFWRWGFGSNIWTRYYTEGSVVVDFINPKTMQIVWRAMVTDTVETGPEKSERQINKGAEELVKHFLKDIKKTR